MHWLYWTGIKMPEKERECSQVLTIPYSVPKHFKPKVSNTILGVTRTFVKVDEKAVWCRSIKGRKKKASHP
jgi:hypothetical protein